MIPRVLVVTPPAGDLSPVLAALDADGPDVAVWLRRPGASARTLVAEGGTLIRRLGGPARLVVGGRLDVAHALGAGVHLPERGLRPSAARRLLGPAALVGASRHDLPGLRALSGASYATLSPFAAVPGKGRPLGAAGFAEIRQAVAELPVLALGGIDAAVGADARRAGADGVAVLRAIARAEDPAAVLAQLRQLQATERAPGA